MTATLDIKIQGREFRVACPPEEVDALQAAAELLDARLGEIARATKSTGERLAVMTALNLANELNQARRLPARGAQPSESSIDAADIVRRIEAIEAQLDTALASQEKPF